MVLTSWLSFFGGARRKKTRGPQSTDSNPSPAQQTAPEPLEERALLSAVSFDALNNHVQFLAAGSVNDNVEITSLNSHTLFIETQDGSPITLSADAVNNPGFVLSSTNSPNDTLTIDTDNAQSIVNTMDVDLGDGSNQIMVGGLNIRGLSIENGGAVTLENVTLGIDGLDAQGQTINVTGPIQATGDITLSTGIAGTISANITGTPGIDSATGDVTLIADHLVLTGDTEITSPHTVQLAPASLSLDMNVGSTTDASTTNLEVSDAELDRITANVVRIGTLVDQGNIYVTNSISLDPGKVPTLSLITAGGVGNTATGNLSVENVRVNAGTQIQFYQTTNGTINVNTIALHSNSSTIYFLNQGDVTVGTVDGVAGVSSQNAQIILGSITGSVTVSDTAADHDVDAGTNDAVIGSFGPKGTIIASGANVSASDILEIIGNQLQLDGTLTANGGEISISPSGGQAFSNAPPPITQINLGGTDDGTNLGISQEEIDRMTANVLMIGDPGQYSVPNIHVTAPINAGTASTLLLAGNSVIQDGGSITVSNLLLRTLNGAGAGTPLVTQVSQLAFDNETTGDVAVTNTGKLTIAPILDQNQSGNLGGGVSLTATGGLEVNTSFQAATDINLAAEETIDSGDNLTIDPGIAILSTNGNITASAGDTLIDSGALTTQISGKMITLTGGDDDADGFGGVTLNGSLNTFDTSPQIFGGSGVDTITIDKNDGQTIGGGTVGLNIDAGTGNDHYLLNFNAGTFTRPIVIDDASGVLDTLQMQGTTTDDIVTYDSSLATPHILIGNTEVDFTGLETASIDALDAQNDTLHIMENVPGFAPPGPGTIATHVPLTYSNFENVTIANNNPTVSNLSVTDSDEGGTATLTGDFSDVEQHAGQTFTLHINWGDGTPVQDVPVVYNSSTQSFSVTHSYADDNPTGTSQDETLVSVTVTDDNGGTSTAATTDALVKNVAPTINVTTFSTGAVEGGTALLQGTYADVGVNDTHVLLVDWADGTPVQTIPVTGGTFSITHVYLDDNPTDTPSDLIFPTLTIQDDDGGTAVAHPQILLQNANPSLDSLTVTSSAPEGSPVTLSGTYSDPGTLDTHQLTIDWGDGTPAQTVNVSGGVFSVQHTYANQLSPGSASTVATIGVTLTDDDNGSTTGSVTTTITNAPPVISNLQITSEIDENGTATLAGIYTDAGANDTHTLDIDWGDGSSIQTVTVSGGVFSVTHQYLDDNPTGTLADVEVVNVTLHDGDGASTTGQTSLTVDNVNPVLSNLQLDSTTINENGTVTVSGTYTDVGTLDTHYLHVNWGDGSGVETINVSGGSFSITHQYLDDNPTGTASDQMMIAVALFDDDGGFSTKTANVTVNNVNPVASITGAPQSVNVDTPVNLMSNVTDQGTLDTFTYSWTVSNGNTVVATGSSSTLSFTPTTPGTYTANLTVTDDDTGTTTATPQTIQVLAVQPTVSINGPSTVVTGQPATYTLTVTDPNPADQSGNFTFNIDWNNDGVTDQTVSGPSGMTITHVYNQQGATSIKVIATDAHSHVSDPASFDVNVMQVAKIGDTLYIGGTTKADAIQVKSGDNGQVRAFIAGHNVGNFVVSHIVVYAGDGNDVIKIDNKITINAIIYGGNGNDKLTGGGGNDTLYGEAGNDTLRGRDGDDVLVGGEGSDYISAGRGIDVMIGGNGTDKLYGFLGNDLFVGGATSHDTDQTALDAIRAQWDSGNTIDTRVLNLKNGTGINAGTRLMPNSDAPDDDDADRLSTTGGLNWLIAFGDDSVKGKHKDTNRLN